MTISSQGRFTLFDIVGAGISFIYQLSTAPLAARSALAAWQLFLVAMHKISSPQIAISGLLTQAPSLMPAWDGGICMLLILQCNDSRDEYSDALMKHQVLPK